MDLILFCSALMTMIGSGLGSLCPSDLVAEISACYANLTGNSYHVMADPDIEQLMAECGQDNFASTVYCVETLYDLCPEEHDLAILRKLASPEFMRKSFRQFCSNIEHYANSRLCIKRQSREIQSCLNDAVETLQSRLEDLKMTHDVFPMYCQYIKQTTACIEGPVRRDCDKRTADIIVVFSEGLTPPMCDDYQSGSSSTSSWFTLTIWLLITAVLCLDPSCYLCFS